MTKQISAILMGMGLGLTNVALGEETWVVASQQDWLMAIGQPGQVTVRDGQVSSESEQVVIRSAVRSFENKCQVVSMTVKQSDAWENWEPIPHLGPVSMSDGPVILGRGPNDYWVFGFFNGGKGKKKSPFVVEDATLEGVDVPLKTTPWENHYDAPGGLVPTAGGYHAWQSRDLVNWVHHGAITAKFSEWVSTAEMADGKLYVYYDYPNDQDPHLYIDEDWTDGKPGRNVGMVFNDPSHGSDCGVIRDLDGGFHMFYEDWSPINAARHSWDSPLGGRAFSKDGVTPFEIKAPAVDHRTRPTGRELEFLHPHWLSHPDWDSNVAKYQEHQPEQHAYGDWAAICIGGQYYLFGDYHPAGSSRMSVARFTSSDINKPFEWCGHVGEGHPDPDIGFAEGKFYLITQTQDFASPGPWVEKVELRMGVDTQGKGRIDRWTEWLEVKELYDYTPGFARQIKRAPASVEFDDLPEGYGFQFEIRLTDTTENASRPVLDALTVAFE